jgi:hypothetical protein
MNARIYLLVYSVAILLGILVYLIFRKKLIERKLLNAISLTLLFCTFYFDICFSFFDTSEMKVFSLRAISFLHLVKISPLISMLIFYFCYWLKNKEVLVSKNIKKANQYEFFLIIIITLVAVALANIYTPDFKGFGHKLLVTVVLMLPLGFIIARRIYWLNKNKNRKK